MKNLTPSRLHRFNDDVPKRFEVEGDSAFGDEIPHFTLTHELTLTSQEFNQGFKRTPIKRAKRRGYLRIVAVALGNTGDMHALPVLNQALENPEPMVREHAKSTRSVSSLILVNQIVSS